MIIGKKEEGVSEQIKAGRSNGQRVFFVGFYTGVDVLSKWSFFWLSYVEDVEGESGKRTN